MRPGLLSTSLFIFFALTLLVPLPARAQCCVCETTGIVNDNTLDEDKVEACFDGSTQAVIDKCKSDDLALKHLILLQSDSVQAHACWWRTDTCQALELKSVCPRFSSTAYIQKKTGEKLDIKIPVRAAIDFTPSVSIPGTCFQAGKPVSTTCGAAASGQTGVTATIFARFIAGLYYFIIASVGILAVVGIMVAGFQYLMAAGAAEKISEAKSRISASVIGLIIALTSYLLFATINPNLVKFEKGIEGLTDVTGKQVALLLGGTPGTCLDSANEVKALAGNLSSKIIVSNGVSDARLRKPVIDRLNTLVDNGTPFSQWLQAHGMQLQINSAYRTMAKQIELRACYEYSFGSPCIAPYSCGSCNDAAKASCSAPHQTGWAVDLCLNGGGSPTDPNNAACGLLKTANNVSGTAADSEQYMLQSFMRQAGFERYKNEWWHFQIDYPGAQTCYGLPGVYTVDAGCSAGLGAGEEQTGSSGIPSSGWPGMPCAPCGMAPADCISRICNCTPPNVRGGLGTCQ